MYASIRKCYLTNPYDSWAPYELALICWTVDAQNLADKWMQRAINLEPDPQRRRLLECERMVYQGDYAAALPGVRQLPPDLKTHYTAAGDLALFCSMQIGDWSSVIRAITANSRQRMIIRLPCSGWHLPSTDQAGRRRRVDLRARRNLGRIEITDG